MFKRLVNQFKKWYSSPWVVDIIQGDNVLIIDPEDKLVDAMSKEIENEREYKLKRHIRRYMLRGFGAKLGLDYDDFHVSGMSDEEILDEFLTLDVDGKLLTELIVQVNRDIIYKGIK